MRPRRESALEDLRRGAQDCALEERSTVERAVSSAQRLVPSEESPRRKGAESRLNGAEHCLRTVPHHRGEECLEGLPEAEQRAKLRLERGAPSCAWSRGAQNCALSRGASST